MRATGARVRSVMPGSASQAATSRSGRAQPARVCQRASTSAGRWWAASRSGVACQDSFGPSARQSAGRRAVPGARRSSTPPSCQSTPSRRRICNSRRIRRRPARVRRESRASSDETCGAKTPAGTPEAPVAACASASSTVTRQPRRARLAATAAPASPAPTTTQWPGVVAPPASGAVATTGRRRTCQGGANSPIQPAGAVARTGRAASSSGRMRKPCRSSIPRSARAGTFAAAATSMVMRVPIRAKRANAFARSPGSSGGAGEGRTSGPASGVVVASPAVSVVASTTISSASKCCARSIGRTAPMHSVSRTCASSKERR